LIVIKQRAATRPPNLLCHKPLPGEERILMIDYALVQAWGKREALTASREVG
jgi:hypothetical protein